LSIEFAKKLKEEKPEATDDEINAEVEALLTEEALSEYIAANFKESDIQTLVDTRKKLIINTATENLKKAYLESAEYTRKISAYVSSAEYTQGVQDYITAQGSDYVERKYLVAIEDQIIAECEKLHAKAVEAVEAAIKEFNASAKSKIGVDEKDLDVLSYNDFVEKRVKAQYYAVYTDPDATT
jgi:hypothetical protein